MQVAKHKEIVAPFAWKGADLQDQTDWIRPFRRAELAEIDAALQGVKRRGLDWVDVTREDFPLPAFSSELAKIAKELETGRGMILLRGLPLAYSPDDLRLAYWGIGAHLGTAVSQGGRGELLGIVEDEGQAVENTKRRGSKTSGSLSFHSDRCDIVGLLCVRKAKSGGMSRIASAAAIHNEVMRRRPDLIDAFYADWHNSRQGDEQPGEARAYPKPIFGFRDGNFTGLFSPAYIQFAQEFPEVPRLTRAQEQALDLFGDLSDELALDMAFEPGDIQLLNNHLIYHARTRYDDYPENDRKRLLLRLWLAVPGSRPLPGGYELLFGSIDAGAVRGGVPARDGWRDVTQLRARKAKSNQAADERPSLIPSPSPQGEGKLEPPLSDRERGGGEGRTPINSIISIIHMPLPTVPTLAVRGMQMPAIAFGTSQLGNCGEIVANALKVGYRHIDTAWKYGTEQGVGEGIKASGVPRKDLFLVTKVSHEYLRADAFAKSVEESLERLQTDYVDLLFVHWPAIDGTPLAETMGALAKAKRAGKARHIGVANFNIALTEDAMRLCPEPLAVLQAEYHPYLDQSRVLAFCRKAGLAFMAYCPLGRGRLFKDPVLAEIAKARGKSIAQVALRWSVQQGNIVPIPRSANPQHMAESLDVFGFTLTDDEMKRIHALARPDGRIANPAGRAPAWD